MSWLIATGAVLLGILLLAALVEFCGFDDDDEGDE